MYFISQNLSLIGGMFLICSGTPYVWPSSVREIEVECHPAKVASYGINSDSDKEVSKGEKRHLKMGENGNFYVCFYFSTYIISLET